VIYIFCFDDRQTTGIVPGMQQNLFMGSKGLLEG